MDIVPGFRLRDSLPNGMRSEIIRPRRVAALEFAHRAGPIEPGFVEGAVAPLAELEGLVTLDAIA